VRPQHNKPALTSSSPPGQELKLLIYVHGTRHDLKPIQDLSQLPTFADHEGCAILAPLFPAGIDGTVDLDSYKRLSSKSLRCDVAFLAILDEVRHIWPGVDTGKAYLLGFSGGGQFAVRRSYLYPKKKNEAVSIGAPDKSQYWNESQNWPIGVMEVFGRKVSVAQLSGVKLQLVVCENDNPIHGEEEFWEFVQKMKGTGRKIQDEASEMRGVDIDLALMKQWRLGQAREIYDYWRQVGTEA
jgi:poly(3-hydroxybutyrate) depolymerase